MTDRSNGRVAAITGAAHGIGRALAVRLAEEGAAVAVIDLVDAADTVAEITAAGGRAASFQGDVSAPARVAALAEEITDALGPVDILVNDAGIYPNQALADITLDGWRRVFAVNVESVLHTTQAFTRGMAAKG